MEAKDKSPDSLKVTNAFTIVFIPSNGYLGISNQVHADMLKNLSSDNKKEILKSYRDGEKPGEREVILPNRWDYQTYGDVYLARAVPVFGKDYMEVSIWQTRKLDILKDSNMKVFLKKLYEKMPERDLENYGNRITKALVHIPKTVFNKDSVLRGKSDYRYYPVKSIMYSLTPVVKRIENVEKEDDKEVSKPNPIYVIKGEQYKLSDLEKRRSLVHLYGSGVIDPVLCAIDLNAYPELEGYVPTNCLGKKVKMEPHPDGISRGKEDWRLVPKWRATSESYSFRDFLNSKNF